MSLPQKIRTPATDLLQISHPVLLAGMNVAAGPKLAAAVTNAGGLGVIGGVGYSPAMLREQVAELKDYLHDKNAPFGIDLLIPQVGGNARKTNYDYTKGKLDDLVDIVIESGAKLFVSAVGVAPKAVVDRLHAAGILYMNMVGHPKHVPKALDAGADLICAQGGEGGGHTGDVPTMILIPAVCQVVAGKKSPLTGKPIQVIAGGGLYNGATVAAALMLGASAAWIGTRFILSEEAGASKSHQEAVRTAGFDDTIRTIIFTVRLPHRHSKETLENNFHFLTFSDGKGRPLRVRKTPYILDWEDNRSSEIKELTRNGVIPVQHDMEKADSEDDDTLMDKMERFMMGKVAAVVNETKSAKAIVDELVHDASVELKKGTTLTQSKL
ncbi:oxidoreductase [Penicillium subrubescens]|uniref:oxidoreductase n=1 Tax=Penicillium subrubescens TaxID=1316194 RepID=UPI0025450437|nr:oxidoreductase [Penicillium subrubescens]KAJ5905478.1 oxidoreductase [Penicillium subrubescens]